MSWEEEGFELFGEGSLDRYIKKAYLRTTGYDEPEDILNMIKRELFWYNVPVDFHTLEPLKVGEDEYTVEARSYTLVENGYCQHIQDVIFTDADLIYYKVSKREHEEEDGIHEFSERVRFVFDTLHFIAVMRLKFSNDQGARIERLTIYTPEKDKYQKQFYRLLQGIGKAKDKLSKYI
ncbi:hypothetical protein [Thermococcus sp.]